ncbi:RcpC/CpaB family pilus assembly protein [Kribbella deserti]|uniref:RcpC/CpaB family pilus assembly protein n=1 Tax=Kribbella deserti TaxID=1926257 RepID=A0ABV6QT96_9ACTN
MSRSEPLRHRLLRAARWHRRPLAAVAAALGVYLALTALAPEPPPTVQVLAAARDLPGGGQPLPADIRAIAIPPVLVPAGALKPGTTTRRTLAAPIRAGEILTDARFVSPALVRRTGPGLVAYPIRFDDAEVVGLLRVGDHIDLYAATSTTSPTATRIATNLQVIALPRGGASASGGISAAGETSRAGGTSGRAGGLVVVALKSEAASRLAQAATNSRLTFALSPLTG